MQGYQEAVRSDAAWPITVNGMGGLVHTRQLRQQDMDAKIRSMEQQYLSSQPILAQPTQIANPYAWPQINESHAPVPVSATNQYFGSGSQIYLDQNSQQNTVQQDFRVTKYHCIFYFFGCIDPDHRRSSVKPFGEQIFLTSQTPAAGSIVSSQMPARSSLDLNSLVNQVKRGTSLTNECAVSLGLVHFEVILKYLADRFQLVQLQENQRQSTEQMAIMSAENTRLRNLLQQRVLFTPSTPPTNYRLLRGIW